MPTPASRGAEPRTVASTMRTTTASLSSRPIIAASHASRPRRRAAHDGTSRHAPADGLQHRLGRRRRRSPAGSPAVRRPQGVANGMAHRDCEHQRRFADGFGAMDGILPIRCAVRQSHVGLRRPIPRGRNLVSRRRVGLELARGVPPQLLGSEPADALQKAAFDLAAVDRLIQRRRRHRAGCRRAAAPSHPSGCRSPPR